jgi:type III secretion protein U
MSEKTEQPTAKKIRDAREKGDVAKSKDFTQTVLIVALFGYLVANGENLMADLGKIILLPFPFVNTDFNAAVNVLIDDFAKEVFLFLWPFLLIVLVLGIFSEAVQTGLLISFEALKPSAKKLNVVSNVANIFSKKNLVEFLKSCLKIVVLSVVVYWIVLDSLPLLMHVPYYGMAELGGVFGEIIKILIIKVGLAYGVISLADFAWQRYEYTKKLMMSKDEVKQEYKGMEGDPLIKSQRKQLHQEMLQNDAVQSSRKATVLVTNPTHLAIALRYDEGETPLPLVLAKGEGALAQKMIDAAREAGVPVMQNIPLAHSLFRDAAMNQYIPSELIEPVAEVLKLIKNLPR